MRIKRERNKVKNLSQNESLTTLIGRETLFLKEFYKLF